MPMLEKIREFFLLGLWSEKRLEDAVEKGVISRAQKGALIKEREEGYARKNS